MPAAFHNRLEAYIKLHDIKIKKLEEVTGKKRAALRRYRLNEVQPDSETTKKICAFLGIEPEDLFYFPHDESHATQRESTASDSDSAFSNGRTGYPSCS